MNGQDTGKIYKCKPRPEWRFFVPILIVMAMTSGLLIYCQTHDYWIYLLDFLLLGFGLSFQWWPVIEIKNGLVRERAMFFLKVMAERVTPFNEFKEILCDLYDDNEGIRYYRVGLRYQDRSIIWIDGEFGSQRLFAEGVAWEISCETGIPLPENALSKNNHISDGKKFET